MKDAITRRAGVYARVSKEDIAKKKCTTSESIENQKRLAEIYVKNSQDDIEITSYYIDDGKTGTVTDRPAYQKLLEDAKNNKINMIIVKDFSRLSRDSVDALKFIEYDIQKLNIRFVSLGEGFDSLYTQNGIDDLKMSFLAVLNSTYPADISRKVCMNLDMKRQDGKFVGAFAPYGYKKDSNNKYLLVIDKPAADIVKKIFYFYLEGMSKQSIAAYLNKKGIYCPTEYKKQNQSLYQPAKKGYPFYIWTYSTIHKILSNEVYIGNLIQKKTKMIKVLEHDKSRKIKVPIEKGKEIKINQTHEAIIDEKTFQIVQQMLKKRTRKIKKQQNTALFSGLLKCSDCGRALYRCYSNDTKRQKMYYYRCSSYKNAPNIACTPHTIKEQVLIDILQYLLKILFELFDENPDIVLIQQNKQQLQIQLEKEQKKYHEGKKRLLYAFTNGIAEENDIIEYQKNYQKKIQNIEKSLQSIQHKQLYHTEPQLNSILLHYFIEGILIKENNDITISFSFCSPFLF